MNYYKIIRGYGAEDYLEIDETELEKAYYCFLEKKDSIFSGGAIKGSSILAIQPDYHRAMGWNRGHKLDSFDYEDLSQKGVDKKHNKMLADKKEQVHYLIKTNQLELIGKNIEINRLENPISLESSKLANKMSV